MRYFLFIIAIMVSVGVLEDPDPRPAHQEEIACQPN